MRSRPSSDVTTPSSTTSHATKGGVMRNLHRLGAVALAAVLSAGLAACGGGGETAGGKVKLVIATFGEFGYDELYKEYMAANPNIEIVPRVTKAEDHHKNIAAHLATGQGAADLEAVEECWLGQFKAWPGSPSPNCGSGSTEGFTWPSSSP